jgi:hypothetical protein
MIYVGWLLEETIAASWLSGCSSLTPGRGHDVHAICILDGTYRRTRVPVTRRLIRCALGGDCQLNRTSRCSQ